MEETQQNFVVMFADIAESTHLYEKLGNTLASQMINKTLLIASSIIKNHKGVVVKTIGDEVMCRFSSINEALVCACALQETMEHQPIHHGVGLVFRMGLHWGPAILQEDGDLFGDAVNIAARMTDIAKPRQIIITEATQNELTDAELISKCREIDRIHVKGKSELISIIEFMWEPDIFDVTHMSTFSAKHVGMASETPLSITYQGNQHTLEPGSAAYTFGRDDQCDQVVGSRLVSRVHAKIESRKGRFFLIDESTNGTYLQLGGKRPIFLRREEIALESNGIISFGEDMSHGSDFLVHFDF